MEQKRRTEQASPASPPAAWTSDAVEVSAVMTGSKVDGGSYFK